MDVVQVADLTLLLMAYGKGVDKNSHLGNPKILRFFRLLR